MFADMDGKEVKKGDVYEYKVMGIANIYGPPPADNSPARYENFRKLWGLSGERTRPLDVRRGKFMDTGPLDIMPENGVVEIEIADKDTDMSLALRIQGMNDRYQVSVHNPTRKK